VLVVLFLNFKVYIFNYFIHRFLVLFIIYRVSGGVINFDRGDSVNIDFCVRTNCYYIAGLAMRTIIWWMAFSF